MKKLILFFIAMLMGTTAFAESFILDNQSHYPNPKEKSTLAIQWASSAKDVEENNNKLRQDSKLDKHSLLALTQTGKLHLTIPKKIEYFRVLAWTHGSKKPTLVTNWVSIIPDKTYALDDAHLIPVVLMAGMGC